MAWRYSGCVCILKYTQFEGKVKLALRVLQIVSHETSESTDWASRSNFGDSFQYAVTPALGDWNFVDNRGGILLPQPVIQGIVNWFE